MFAHRAAGLFIIITFTAICTGHVCLPASDSAPASTPVFLLPGAQPTVSQVMAHYNSDPSSISVAAPFPTAPVSLPLVTTLDGKPFDICANKGYKVIYFFSNGCPCCRNCETLTFKPLSQEYAGKVSFYAVVSGGWDLHDDRANFLSLLETHHLPFPVLLDTTHGVADMLGGITSSQAVLLSPDNRVLFDGAADDSKEYTNLYGHLGLSKTYLADAIAEALAGKPITLPYVHPRGCSIAK